MLLGRLGCVWALLFAGLVAGAQWSPQDYEIFDIARALEQAEGSNVTFYSFLNITSRANVDEISRAYKKRSLQLHPDKNRGVKDAQKRFERLGLIAKVLRTPEVRERYDHFHRNGFPKWKGTGYFYSRYRPGFGAVLLLLLLVIAGFHWLGMVIAAASHRTRINGHIKDARDAAGYPGLSKRKRVTTETGRVFVVETTGEVYLLEGNDEFLLNPDQVPAATFQRTLLVQLPRVLYRYSVGHFLPSPVEHDDGETAETTSAVSEAAIETKQQQQQRKMKSGTRKRH